MRELSGRSWESGDNGGNAMPWYWILIIISAIIGPFEAMHALNKARRNRDEAEKRRRAEESKDDP